MAEGEITTFPPLTERFNLPLGNYKHPKLLYCSNGGHFLRILPDGKVDGTRDRSDQHIQLQLSAESVGEVYIKSTHSGHYLAMDPTGMLYGSLPIPAWGSLAAAAGGGVPVPGKAGGKPLQHLRLQKAR
ncbi:fibroblast growth factor 1 isoform X3 [Heliangelus exortis]|uniref:fibroblast growth factor 1 isoform X3 n=1 Tax=Heliangelus exortis TaxID=472823 RepID=UPI003A8C96DB